MRLFKMWLVVSILLVVGLGAGLRSTLVPADTPVANAACFGGWPACINDPTRTSSLTVYHVMAGGSPDPVAPDTTEEWTVAARYSPEPGNPCNDLVFNAYIAVWNDGSGYSYSCTGCDTAPFQAITLCDPTICAEGTGNEYTIALDMESVLGSTGVHHLTAVTYSSTSIDDGVTIDSNCDSIRSVTPTRQTWSNTDTTFPCSYDCTSDTSITITYE